MRKTFAALILIASAILPVSAPTPAVAAAYDCGPWQTASSGSVVKRLCHDGPGESYAIVVDMCGATGCRTFWSSPAWCQYGHTQVVRASGYYWTPGLLRTVYNSPATKAC